MGNEERESAKDEEVGEGIRGVLWDWRYWKDDFLTTFLVRDAYPLLTGNDQQRIIGFKVLLGFPCTLLIFILSSYTELQNLECTTRFLVFGSDA
jgi:hypothetical protein